jgi:hypothetical protein
MQGLRNARRRLHGTDATLPEMVAGPAIGNLAGPVIGAALNSQSTAEVDSSLGPGHGSDQRRGRCGCLRAARCERASLDHVDAKPRQPRALHVEQALPGCTRGGRIAAEKPFGHDLGLRAGAQPVAPCRISRGGRLPYRSLPRQGGGLSRRAYVPRVRRATAGAEVGQHESAGRLVGPRFRKTLRTSHCTACFWLRAGSARRAGRGLGGRYGVRLLR